MPKGTRHTLTGTLRWTGRNYKLDVDGGGYWILDIPCHTHHLVDQMVVVEGVRSGFNLLDVERVRAEGSEWPPDSWWMRLKRRLAG